MACQRGVVRGHLRNQQVLKVADGVRKRMHRVHPIGQLLPQPFLQGHDVVGAAKLQDVDGGLSLGEGYHLYRRRHLAQGQDDIGVLRIRVVDDHHPRPGGPGGLEGSPVIRSPGHHGDPLQVEARGPLRVFLQHHVGNLIFLQPLNQPGGDGVVGTDDDVVTHVARRFSRRTRMDLGFQPGRVKVPDERVRQHHE